MYWRLTVRPFLGSPLVIPNHSYVDIGMVGTSFSDSVQCRSDLSDNHNGQWYFPDSDPLSGVGDIYKVVTSTRVDLRRRNNTNSPTGIYHCEIVVSGNADGARVYVGLYINKWKNHFYKMKGDVGMSGHEKERKQEDAYTKIQTHS